MTDQTDGVEGASGKLHLFDSAVHWLSPVRQRRPLATDWNGVTWGHLTVTHLLYPLLQ